MKDKKYAFYTYTNPNTGAIRTGDMPWKDWERIQRDRSRQPHFKLDRTVDMNSPDQASAPSGGKTAVPIEEDKLECPLCGYVAKDDSDLKAHKQEKHA